MPPADTHPQARADLDALFADMDEAPPSDAMRWAVYGYVYGLRHAGRLSADDFDAALDRLGLSPDEADDAGVWLV